MRLHEPEPLVHCTGDFRQDIRRVIILELVHLLDCPPGSGSEGGQSGGQGINVLLAAGQLPTGNLISVLRAATVRAVPSATPPS